MLQTMDPQQGRDPVVIWPRLGPFLTRDTLRKQDRWPHGVDLHPKDGKGRRAISGFMLPQLRE